MMRGRYDFTLSLIALGAGFLIPFWPLIIAGTLGSVVSGHIFVALTAGFLFDLIFGSWPGFFLPFPMTVLVTAVSIGFFFIRRYLRSR
jgi:hypothetical protein